MIDILTTIDRTGYAHMDVGNGEAKTLTVGELIAKLEACDPDALVMLRDGYTDGVVTDVVPGVAG